jgi:branched-chain amino acid transport system substrate-binding protein
MSLQQRVKIRLGRRCILRGLCLATLFLTLGCNATTTNGDVAPIDVVVIVPQSGRGASNGDYVRTGLEMFANDHPNSRLRVTIVDSESDPQKAVTGFRQQLAIRKPRAAISVLSPVSDALAPIAEENQILLIGVNTATDTFVQKYSYTQRINDRPAGHTAPLARLAARKYKRVAVIYANETYGQFANRTFAESFSALNKNELTQEPFNPNERDQNIVVQRVLASKPEAIFVVGYGPQYIAIFQALRTFKYQGQIMADISVSNPDVLSALGDAAEGVVFAAMGFNVTPPATPQAVAFLEAFQARFQREPWLGSAFAYDAMAILDRLDTEQRPFERNSVYALKNWPGIAAPLSFPSPGECEYVFQFARRMGGKNLPVDLATL